MVDAMVPAAPPDRRLYILYREAVIVRVATAVDPPRHEDLPPRNMLAVALAPSSGRLSGGVVDELLLHLLDWVG